MKLKQWIMAMVVVVPTWAMAEATLVGQWVMPVPNNPQCSEIYRFDANGQVNISSGYERVSGRYEVVKSDGLPQMNTVFTSDNQMIDCFGKNVDQTGQRNTHFLRWTSENHVQFCSDMQGMQCPVGLHRQ